MSKPTSRQRRARAAHVTPSHSTASGPQAPRRLRVAFYMTTVLEYGGGMETYYINTAAHLASQGVDVDVITMDDAYTRRIIRLLGLLYRKKIDMALSFKLSTESVTQRLGGARYIKVKGFKNLRARLREYDVVYSKNELLEGFIFKFLIRYQGIPPVIFGGHTPLRYSQARSLYAKFHNMLYTGPLYRFLASGVSRFHAINSAEYELYQQLFPNHKVYKIYNPFDAAAFRRGAEGKSSPLRLDDSAMNVLWVGRLTEQKGIDDLVALITWFNTSAQEPIAWHIAGDGEDRPAVEQLANRFENVTCYGHIEPELMPATYRDADLFLCTSKWEGYPYILLEARAFGLPIVSSNIPGATDILQRYPAGRLTGGLNELETALIDALVDFRCRPERTIPDDEFRPAQIYQQLLRALGDNA